MQENLRKSYIEFIERLRKGRGFWENGVIVCNDAAVKEKIKELKSLI